MNDVFCLNTTKDCSNCMVPEHCGTCPSERYKLYLNGMPVKMTFKQFLGSPIRRLMSKGFVVYEVSLADHSKIFGLSDEEWDGEDEHYMDYLVYDIVSMVENGDSHIAVLIIPKE